MDRMLVMVFEDETKALEGKEALLQLDSDGSISIYAYAVIAKHPDGTVTVNQGDDHGRLGTLAGTSLGSLVGRLSRPTGLVLGAAGPTVGATTDRSNAIGEDFIDDVTKVLLPNRVAVVAEIAEEWTTPVDTRIGRIGGIVFRWTLSEGRHAIDDEDVDAMKADHPE
jgi:uncharacterized membrane protein